MRSVLVRLAVGAFLMAALIVGPGLYGHATAGTRLAPSLADATGLVNVRVTLGFQPQQFHQQQLTSFGVFAGRDGNTVRLLRVPAANLSGLAALYWVKSIEPFNRTG